MNICTYGTAQQACLQAAQHSKHEQHYCVSFYFRSSSPYFLQNILRHSFGFFVSSTEEEVLHRGRCNTAFNAKTRHHDNMNKNSSSSSSSSSNNVSETWTELTYVRCHLSRRMASSSYLQEATPTTNSNLYQTATHTHTHTQLSPCAPVLLGPPLGPPLFSSRARPRRPPASANRRATPRIDPPC